MAEHYCNRLKPPLRITTPTLTLYWVVLKNKVEGPNDPPVKKTREHSAATQMWPNRDVTTHFPANGLGGKRRTGGVHSVGVDGVELPSPLLAEAQLIDCGISALV